MFDPRAVQAYRHDADNFVGTYKNVVVQVRNGQMTMPALRHIESVGRIVVGKQKGPVGVLVVLEETAEVTEAATRHEQTRVIRDFDNHHAHCFAVNAIMGSGAKATLLRAVGRVLVMSQPRFAIVSDVQQAAAWLGPRVGIIEPELTELGDWVRRLGKEPPLHEVVRDAQQ